MYRVVLYALASLVVIALGLSATQQLGYSSYGVLAATLIVLVGLCFSTNLLLGKLYNVATNHESAIITALILFFVLATPTDAKGWIGIAFAAIVAMVSKYVITWRSTHIFNPAALGVLIVSLLGIGYGDWWIANSALLIPMIIAGFLVLLKLRRFELFLAFFVSAMALILFKTVPDAGLGSAVTTAVTLYPLLFLGAIMLTEPATMPLTRSDRLIFGVLVGIVFAINADFGFIGTSPELALLVGNLFAFMATKRSGVVLSLVDKQQLTPTTYGFTFKPSRSIAHIAGQYMEFTLPAVGLDSRGNRRTFTIASPPSDELIRIGVKFYEPSSQFKTKLMSLQTGDKLTGGHVAGDFVLPDKASDPVILIAGGIGITPFIAMIQEILANKTDNPVDLYYFVRDKSEIAYKDILNSALKHGIKVHLKIGPEARLTSEDIEKHDAAKARFYISGPPGLVNAYQAQLKSMHVKRVTTDYFTGY